VTRYFIVLAGLGVFDMHYITMVVIATEFVWNVKSLVPLLVRINWARYR